jgi:hypothetical protein
LSEEVLREEAETGENRNRNRNRKRKTNTHDIMRGVRLHELNPPA